MAAKFDRVAMSQAYIAPFSSGREFSWNIHHREALRLQCQFNIQHQNASSLQCQFQYFSSLMGHLWPPEAVTTGQKCVGGVLLGVQHVLARRRHTYILESLITESEKELQDLARLRSCACLAAFCSWIRCQFIYIWRMQSF